MKTEKLEHFTTMIKDYINAATKRVFKNDMNTLLRQFPNASESFLKRNPATLCQPDSKTQELGRTGTRKGIPNKTEAEFETRLQVQMQLGEILRYEYEGITLRWESGDKIIKYTPDFVVFRHPSDLNYSDSSIPIKFIEVKGPFIKGKFERAIERFRHARTYWNCFSFELWQKTKDGWGTPKI